MKYFYLVYAYFSAKFREDFIDLFRRGTKVRDGTRTTERTVGNMGTTIIH
jgi:hypothetical protein